MIKQYDWITSVSDEELVNIQKRWLQRKNDYQKEVSNCEDMLMQIHMEKAERGLFKEQNRKWLEEFKRGLHNEC